MPKDELNPLPPQFAHEQPSAASDEARIAALEARLTKLSQKVEQMYPHLWHQSAAEKAGLFYVGLSGTPSSGGDATSAPTITYTVTNSDGATIGTSLSPAVRPAGFGYFDAATKGIAYHSGADAATVTLLIAFETEGTQADCDT